VPFFLAEYITALKSGMLHPKDDLWQLPHRVRDMLIVQLAHAGNMGKEILSAASIIGRSFDFDMLCEVSGHNEEDIIRTLEQLIRQGLIQELPAIQLKNENEGMRILMYTFGHDQLRRLTYEETSQARRCLFHRRAAEAMISRGAEQHAIDSLTEQIAYHYRMANSPSKSAEWNQRLARQRQKQP
jgi:predicted ATPase